MGRAKVNRTPEEQEAFELQKREKRRLYQQNYRKRQREIETDNNRPNILQTNTIDENVFTEHYAGKMEILCKHCKARHFIGEKVANKGNSFNDCCSHGAVVLEPLPVFPTELKSLFIGEHVKSNVFYQRIRSYNNSFAFASFNANLINFQSQRNGPYCFKIQGQIYYQINTALYPEPNDSPTFGQLFIVDPSEATDLRMNQNRELNSDVLKILEQTMRTHNIFTHSYQMMNEEIKNQQQLLAASNCLTTEPELQLLFTLKPGMDKRRFNFQRVNEVAAVFSTNADGEIPESYVTIRNKNTKSLTFISTMDPNVEPWIYPLFFPYGTQGWHRDLYRINSNRRITRSAYAKYRLSIRDDEFNAFLYGRRLFQQWIVDSYVKVEKDRIQFCKENQKQLRADSYQGLVDYLQNAANDNNARVGKMIILPSTFIGSPRNMILNYQDAMAIVRSTGKPDLFITMTCNPNWTEIKENLLPNQQPSDRPDICARVFNLKKNHLIDLIVRKQIFGEVEAYVYVVEFQKRGLPHIHLLVTLKRHSKLKTSDAVDKFISAEIPDPIKEPKLHNIVMKNMIHGPCGDWCIVNGVCSKHFPKSFQEETLVDANGYPQYRRRYTGKTYLRQPTYEVDNRHVVPYCAQLLLIFNAHINVEVVSNIQAVKYLYKYVYKGHDAAGIVIQNESGQSERIIDHDEIKDYIETRYVGPVEACWRILSKILQEKSHAITRLPVHLPFEHHIYVDVLAGCDENAFRAVLDQITMLMDYFELNKRDPEARKYLYHEIPCYYTFRKEGESGEKISKWRKRKRHFNTIGRMYSVSPTQIELFHLRLLLLHIKGATSYNDLKTVNGQTFETFSHACLALGIIEDDQEWKRAMQEATVWMMPRQLRSLFVRILVHCQPLYPEQLWEEFKCAMSEDYSRHEGSLRGEQKAYIQIKQLLELEGQHLSNFPSMNQTISELDQFPVEYFLNDNEPSVNRQSSQYELLNEQQKQVVDAVLTTVDGNSDKFQCIYIDGPGGSGKTFIYTTLYGLLKNKKKNIKTMAFTGIAAILLPNGKTVHKTFGLPVPIYADSVSNIKVQSKEAQCLKETDVFIWDEAPMAPRHILEIVDRTLKDIMNNDKPFGGKIMILGGDFRQLLPVKVNATKNELVNLSIKYSYLWKFFTIFTLTENMRVLPHEIEFAKFLLDVGNGILNSEHNILDLPEKCIATNDRSIAYDIYGDLIAKHKYKEMSKCAILSARNIDVDEINNEVVQLLDESSEHIYTSINSVDNCDNGNDIAELLLPEYLSTLNPSSLPPHELQLRNNCIVMLIRNVSIHEGLCNGTRLRILEFSNNLLKCEILTGDKAGGIVFLNRITLYCENEYPFTFKRRQFPIKIAFAMTINKSQGQTFEKIGIDLRKDVFNHGQLYVAMSRVRSWESLKIYLTKSRNSNKIKNYVYTELFQ